ncbi:hypothetical protein [Paractinoplanes lichenicola]|uniref:Uncharacterized protein n=1 Tax=Paractinoplanes lichenicola TaxID=2802976 RepID=A0ABS1VPI6_9ACTN|nr:hypothetical protein [Actinoplanes lichenicola]MBL7255436.1 hypothetical protein [Actinoplanes lichenicola]
MSDDSVFEELADAADASARLTHARLGDDELQRRYQRVARGGPRPETGDRPQILDIWRAIAEDCVREDLWVWGDGPVRDAVADAEQLLCLLLPATRLPRLALDRPDMTSQEVLAALAPLGDERKIPHRLAAILLDYYAEHADNGTPTFTGSVDSYAVSVTLSLATLGFVRIFRTSTARQALRDQLRDLEERASVRLTAAQEGLLRTFSVTEFDTESPAGRALLAMVNQDRLPVPQVVARLRADWQEMLAAAPETLVADDRDADLLECGWPGGITATVTALEAVEELISERTRVLGLLDEEQQRLSRKLQLRYELALSYWAGIATFGSGRWPVEDVPWVATDGESSDYNTLQVASLAMKGMVARRGADAQLARIGSILLELADRARITRRSAPDEPHEHPDFAPLLLQRAVQLAGLVTDAHRREALLALVDRMRDHHMPPRRSWHTTIAVVRALVAVSVARAESPVRSGAMADFTSELLTEAEHLYDREMLDPQQSLPEQLERIGADLRRAREIRREKPGVAAAVAADVNRRLRELAAARESRQESQF